jgi:hypothetical protein
MQNIVNNLNAIATQLDDLGATIDESDEYREHVDEDEQARSLRGIRLVRAVALLDEAQVAVRAAIAAVQRLTK